MVICISGMHRSGTSLFASWLEQCDLVIDDGNVLEASTGNSKGHYEDLDFMELHHESIEEGFPDSFGWKVLADDFLAFSSAHLARAQQLVETRNTKYANWGWKDPRSILYLPQWKEIIPDLCFVFTWRPCALVVLSLNTYSDWYMHQSSPLDKILFTNLARRPFSS